MKRIVDIPDKVVKAIQNGEDYRYDIHTAIAQSTPYNPTGDLISREQVIEELMAHQYSQDFCKEHGIEYSINSSMVRIIVKECPTVPDRYNEGYAQGYVDGSTGADWKGGAE